MIPSTNSSNAPPPSPISLSHFTISSHNIYGLNSTQRQLELSMFLSRTRPAVVVLQEPKLNFVDDNKQPPRMTHYHAIHFTHPVHPTGIVMYVHESVSFHIMSHVPHALHYHPDRSRTLAAFIWVSHPLLPSPIVVGGVYISHQTTEDDVIALTHAITNMPFPTIPLSTHLTRTPVFLLGDFNSRHPIWDNNVTSPTTQLDKWIHQHLLTPTALTQHIHMPTLTLLNTRFTSSKYHHTHVNTSHYLESVLDLAMSSHPHMVSSMHVLSDSGIQSDHYPITITFHPPLRPQSDCSHIHDRLRWRVSADDETWKLFTTRIDDAIPAWISSYEQYNTATSSRMSQSRLDECTSKSQSLLLQQQQQSEHNQYRLTMPNGGQKIRTYQLFIANFMLHEHVILGCAKQHRSALALTQRY